MSGKLTHDEKYLIALQKHVGESEEYVDSDIIAREVGLTPVQTTNVIQTLSRINAIHKKENSDDEEDSERMHHKQKSLRDHRLRSPIISLTARGRAILIKILCQQG